jgi:hypothetical protein
MWMKPKNFPGFGQTRGPIGCVPNVFARFQPTPRSVTASTTGTGYWRRVRFAERLSPRHMPVSAVGVGWHLAQKNFGTPQKIGNESNAKGGWQ